MRRPTTMLTLAGLSVVPAITTWTNAAAPLTLQPESRLWVDGTSTVRAWRCDARKIGSRVETAAPGAVGAVVAGEKAVQSAELTITTADLDCRNGTMNEHMLKALKATEFPTIVFRVSTYELARDATKAVGTARGELWLGGVAKPITVTGAVTQETDGSLHITGSHPLRMTAYGLKPPSLMIGTMKVRDEVKVGFDLRLKE